MLILLLTFSIHQTFRELQFSPNKRSFLDLSCRSGRDCRIRIPQRIERKSHEVPCTLNELQSSQRKAPGWWRNLTLVERELMDFNAKFTNCTSTLLIPSENKLRAHAGGMELIHAIRMHGGVKSFRAKLMGEVTGLNVPYNSFMSFSQIRANSENSSAKIKSSYARFVKNNSEFLRNELIAFNKNYTNNIHWNIMPSLAQLRHGKRRDLINAIDRLGGR
jgi:hypothetical protein